MSKTTKLLFDGNCIVCDMEISHYKKIAPKLFDIIDISHPDFKASEYNLTTKAVNKHIHAIGPDGELLIGVDAFAHIWDQIDKYNWAAKAIRTPGIYALSKAGYAVFASIIRPMLPKKKR